jgi:hypothetical protein
MTIIQAKVLTGSRLSAITKATVMTTKIVYVNEIIVHKSVKPKVPLIRNIVVVR